MTILHMYNLKGDKKQILRVQDIVDQKNIN